MLEFHAHGAVASESLIHFLIKENNKWARDLLTQCFGIPEREREALLAGEIEWIIPNGNTIIIGPMDSSP